MIRTLRRCARVGVDPRVRGTVWIHGKGEIRIGDRVTFDAADAPIELHAAPGATITIGDDCVLSAGACIDATSSITLGARCRVGAFCKAMDNHFHPLQGDRNVRPPATPVVVEDDVELGAHAILLPGAYVERGARIGARAVVRRHVPAGAVVPGKPLTHGHCTQRAPAPAAPAAHEETPVREATAREGPRLGARPLAAKAARLASEALRFVRLAATDRAAALRRLRRYAGVVRAAILFRRCRRGALVNAQGAVKVVADGEIRLGDGVQFVRGAIPTALVSHRGGELAIGAGSILAHSASLEAWRSVRIGARCMIASSVRVCDRDEDGEAPIVIGDDVWLAHGVLVEPGVTIGAGSVVSAGSVVRHDVPPRSLAAGNPAVCGPLGTVDVHARRPAPRHA